jgi:hypothetical protein
MAEIPPLHVIVKFGKDVPGAIQGAALLAFERKLREMAEHKLWIEVFKETKGDDQKLRVEMTPEQRKSLA